MKSAISKVFRPFRSLVERLSFRAKFMFASVFVLVLFIGMVSVALFNTNRLMKSVFQVSMAGTALDWMAKASVGRSDVVQSVWNAAFYYETGKPVAAQYLKEFNSNVKSSETNLTKFEAELGTHISDKTKENLGKARSQWESSLKKMSVVVKTLEEGKATKAELDKQINDFSDDSLAVADYFSSLSTELRGSGSDSYAESIKIEKLTWQSMFGVFGFSLIFTFSLMAFVNFVAKTLQHNAGQLKVVSTNLGIASKKIAGAASQLSAGTHEQASSLQETIRFMSWLLP